MMMNLLETFEKYNSLFNSTDPNANSVYEFYNIGSDEQLKVINISDQVAGIYLLSINEQTIKVQKK